MISLYQCLNQSFRRLLLQVDVFYSDHALLDRLPCEVVVHFDVLDANLAHIKSALAITKIVIGSYIGLVVPVTA